ncbi:MAG: CDP-glucose 4,6-dehydratase [Candidatus Lindowbacteria bacterium]|nr:CDP-glucose 4,6-dehydratase [Candidatus Lindowbacteria bacterium]
MKDELSLFRGKKVLVTGDSGFKGAWLSIWLSELGADVTGISLPPLQDEDLFNIANIGDSICHHNQDIRDYAGVEKIFQETKPEFVFHLAAQALVRRSYREPRETFETNVIGSVNILDAVRNTDSVRSVIFVTTDKCYKNNEWTWGYRENDELGGRDPYSASKAAAEIAFFAYWNSYFDGSRPLGMASVRAGNVIGGGDWAEDRIVPDCIRALSNGDPIRLRNPGSTRPWQHVLDPLGGYLKLATKTYLHPDSYSGSWNFGPDSTSIRTVQDLAEEIIDVWGEGTLKIDREENAPHEATLLHLNCDKAHFQLGWRPSWDFKRSVRETAQWHRDVTDGQDPLETTKKQIHQYLKEVN